MAITKVWRSTHPLDSEWEFIELRRDTEPASLSIAEGIVLWHRLGEVLTEYEKTHYCITCGRAPYMFVNGDCSACNPLVSK